MQYYYRLLLFFILTIMSAVIWGQTAAPAYRTTDVDGDTLNLHSIEDTLIVATLGRTFNLYTRPQMAALKQWLPLSSRPVQFWFVSSESSTLVRAWRDTLVSRDSLTWKDDFRHFVGSDRTLNVNLSVAPTLLFFYNLKQYATVTGYSSWLQLDSVYRIVDSLIIESESSQFMKNQRNRARVQIEPNPSRHSFSIHTQLPVSSCQLYDLLGRSLAVIPPGSPFEWPSDCPSGVYALKIRSETQIITIPICHIK